MATKQTQLGTGDAAGKKMHRKAQRCVKKQLPMRETRKFLHSSPYVAVLCISGQNSADNTPVFWLLLNSVNASFLPITASRLGVGLRLGVDTAKTADSYHRMSHSAINPQGDEEEGGTSVVKTFFCASNHYMC